MIVIFKRLTETAYEPRLATIGAAGYDLYSDEEGVVIIPPGGHRLIQTNVAMAIPQGWVGLICPRSGLSLKHSMTVHNGPGVIDSDYRGGIGVILHNTSATDGFGVTHGERVGQILFMQTPMMALYEVSKLEQTDRSAGGFGSTGR